MTEPRRRYNMFYRANAVSKKDKARILKENLFDEWVAWNVTDSTRFRAMNLAIDWRKQHPTETTTIAEMIAEYETIARINQDAATNEMANWCMGLIFNTTDVAN